MSAPRLIKADNDRWYVHWSDGRRSKRVSTGAKSLDEAKAFLAQWILMEQEGPVPATTTVAELWAIYAEKHLTGVSAPETAKHSWNNMKQHFGEMLPLAIDQDAIDLYLAKREKGRIGRPSKSSTVRRELSYLRSCLNWCVARGKLDAPPRFDLPEEGEPRDRWLREDEVRRLLEAAAKPGEGRMSRIERFLWLALYTAGRKTALLELTWDRVDFETNVIHLEVPGRKKTKKRRASVPIAAALRPVLERMHAERVSDLVLDSKADVWSATQSVVRRAGLAPKVKRPTGTKAKATGVSPHTLRHTAATHMARRGVPLYIISKILGNTLAMVERVYAKHCPDDLREAVDTINERRAA